MEVFNILDDEFPKPPEAKPEIELMWGASNLNRSEVYFYNTSYKGEIQFDHSFAENFHTEENQLYAFETCNKIRDVEGVVNSVKKEKFGEVTVVTDTTVKCWILDF